MRNMITTIIIELERVNLKDEFKCFNLFISNNFMKKYFFDNTNVNKLKLVLTLILITRFYIISNLKILKSVGFVLGLV